MSSRTLNRVRRSPKVWLQSLVPRSGTSNPFYLSCLGSDQFVPLVRPEQARDLSMDMESGLQFSGGGSSCCGAILRLYDIE